MIVERIQKKQRNAPYRHVLLHHSTCRVAFVYRLISLSLLLVLLLIDIERNTVVISFYISPTSSSRKHYHRFVGNHQQLTTADRIPLISTAITAAATANANIDDNDDEFPYDRRRRMKQQRIDDDDMDNYYNQMLYQDDDQERDTQQQQLQQQQEESPNRYTKKTRTTATAAKATKSVSSRPYWEEMDVEDSDDEHQTIDDDDNIDDDNYEDDDDYYKYYSNKNDNNEADFDDEYYDDDDDDDEEEYQFDNNTNNNNNQSNELVWEKCRTRSSGTVYVILPPISIPKPTCIIHFIGGTVLGSAPQIWYQHILQDIVYHTNCCMIVSTIPITLPLWNPLQTNQQQQQISPLNHIQLSKQIKEQFRMAYTTILMDEYDYTTILQSIPICGMGHSLGARLLTVLTTATLGKIQIQQPMKRNKRSGVSSNMDYDNSIDEQVEQQQQRNVPEYVSYQSMILISFTNYGAAAGIPGISTLFRKSRTIEQQEQQRRKQQQQQRQQNRRREMEQQQRQRQRRNRSQRRNVFYDDDYDDDDDDEEEDDINWLEVWNDVTNFVSAGTTQLQSIVTPSTKSLEFVPSPQQLWDALQYDAQRYTNIVHTLLVQFDDDIIDQSSKLASIIQNCTDVYFTRIRGNHLTPMISISSYNKRNKRNSSNRNYNIDDESILQRMNYKIGRMLLAIQGKSSKQRNRESYLELRQSIVRYIIDIVATQKVS